MLYLYAKRKRQRSNPLDALYQEMRDEAATKIKRAKTWHEQFNNATIWKLSSAVTCQILSYLPLKERLTSCRLVCEKWNLDVATGLCKPSQYQEALIQMKRASAAAAQPKILDPCKSCYVRRAVTFHGGTYCKKCALEDPRPPQYTGACELCCRGPPVFKWPDGGFCRPCSEKVAHLQTTFKVDNAKALPPQEQWQQRVA